MKIITDEVARALDAQLYYLALNMTLTLPDICAALEAGDGLATGPRYRAWCDQWLPFRVLRITSHDLWRLRCGVVHRGQLGHPDLGYSRVLFTLPTEGGHVFHRNVIDGALNLDAPRFCQEVVDAVESWWAGAEQTPNVQANLPGLVQLRPNGLAPYMVGAPLIA